MIHKLVDAVVDLIVCQFLRYHGDIFHDDIEDLCGVFSAINGGEPASSSILYQGAGVFVSALWCKCTTHSSYLK